MLCPANPIFAEGKLSAPAIAVDDVARRARHRITLRLLPYVLLLYVIAYLDRNNLATAALQMPHDLGFDDRVIGFGAGIFALGYVILEIHRGALECTLPFVIWSGRLPSTAMSWGWSWGLIQAVPLVQRHNPNLRSPFAWKLTT